MCVAYVINVIVDDHIVILGLITIGQCLDLADLQMIQVCLHFANES
jgi:hypothetical protein